MGIFFSFKVYDPSRVVNRYQYISCRQAHNLEQSTTSNYMWTAERKTLFAQQNIGTSLLLDSKLLRTALTPTTCVRSKVAWEIYCSLDKFATMANVASWVEDSNMLEFL
jgi:hypothetical protein